MEKIIQNVTPEQFQKAYSTQTTQESNNTFDKKFHFQQNFFINDKLHDCSELLDLILIFDVLFIEARVVLAGSILFIGFWWNFKRREMDQQATKICVSYL